MKTRRMRRVKHKPVKEDIILPKPLYSPETDLSDPVMEFEADTDCDVFTILSGKEKKQRWNKALTTLKKKIDEYVSKRKKSCSL